MTFELDPAAKTATFTDVDAPAAPTTVAVPAKVSYDGADYAVTSMAFSAWSAKVANVTGLQIPDSVTDLDGANFRHFPDLESITIPGSVKAFGGSFQNLKKLTTLTFGEGVEDLTGNSMVSGCTALATVNLPSSLKKITGTAIFAGATALESIALPEGLDIEGINTFAGCSSLKSVTLPASMTEIPMNTFDKCTSLTEVKANSSITKIGSGAFSGCTALTSIPDLSKVKQMGSSAFNNCNALRADVDLSSLDAVPARAFTYAPVNVTKLSPHLTSIGDWAFINSTQSSIELPTTLRSIGTYAFYYSKLTGKLIIPDFVTSIGTSAFVGTSISELSIGSGLTKIDSSVFPSSVTKVTINAASDDITYTKDWDSNVTVNYELPSIETDDKIAVNGETLQKAIDDSGSSSTIYLKKNVQLSETVVVRKDKNVTLRPEGDTRIITAKEGKNVVDLIKVEEGATLTLAGAEAADTAAQQASDGSATLTLFGRYNSGAGVYSEGALKLNAGSVVTRFKVNGNQAGAVVVKGGGGCRRVGGRQDLEQLTGGRCRLLGHGPSERRRLPEDFVRLD